MEINTFTIQLKDLVPSDVPRLQSWKKAKTTFPDKDRLCFTTLNQLGIEVCQTTYHGLVPLDGNHKLARLIELLGNNTVVAVALTFGITRLPQTLIQPCYLDERVEKVQKLGLLTFIDFITVCNAGHFERFTPYSEGNDAILFA